MQRQMCKAKLHGVTVTESNLNYVGSITIDRDLLEAADLIPYEWLHIVNVSTGDRFETYVIEGPRGSGVIGLNGATARRGLQGDKLIVMSYALFSPAELADFKPRLVFVDSHNHILRLDETEAAQETFHTRGSEA